MLKSVDVLRNLFFLAIPMFGCAAAMNLALVVSRASTGEARAADVLLSAALAVAAVGVIREITKRD